GKKLTGSNIETDRLIETVEVDIAAGAHMVTVEGRESGANVGIYDEHGNCDRAFVLDILRQLDHPDKIMWETPRKAQQLFFIKLAGANVNLGNIAPDEVMALEALRRGLRSDT